MKYSVIILCRKWNFLNDPVCLRTLVPFLFFKYTYFLSFLKQQPLFLVWISKITVFKHFPHP